MANISDERLLAAVRGYVDTIGRANDIGEIRRNLNSSVTKIESTSYRSTFPRQVKFRVGANGELSAFGPTAGKRDLSRALTDLRDRRRASTDERTDEDTRIDETINTLLGSLDVAINRAERIEQAANREYDELVANLSEMAERSENRENGNNENEGSYEYPLTNRPVNFVMDTEGRVSTTGSISNRTVIANRIDDLIQSDRLTPEVRTYAESLLSDMRDSIAREVAANDRSENANIRAELEASEGEVRYENYQELHRRIREIGEVDRTTPPEEKRRTDNFGIKPGVLVSRVQDTDLQSMLDSVVGFRYDRDGNFRAYSGNIRQKRLMLVRLQNMLGLDELSDEDKVVVNRLIQGLSRDVDRQITEERQADQNRNEEEQTTEEQQTEQDNTQGEQETEQENTQEPEQEYENREIEAVTRETIQDRINYYEGILANQNRMQPVLTTISREDARRYQEINRQRAEREANSNSNLPEDLSYDQDRINQELSRSDLSTDERTRLLDLQNSRQYQEIVNNRTRELDNLIEERRNALDARRAEIESSPRTIREEVETDLDINNFPRISNEDFIRTVLRQNGVSEEEIDATINEYSMETVEDANGLYDDGPLSRSIVVRTRTIEPGSRETETREPVEGMDNLYIETYGNGRLQGQDLVRAILRQEMNMSEEEINENINNYDVEVRDGAEGMDDGVVTPIRLVRVTRNQPELTDAEREELDGMQAEIDTLTRERDNLINADITRSPEEETAFVNGLENVSDETKNRINMLMSTYQYTITTERETEQVSEADIQRANDVLPELRDLLSRTSDEKPYVEASEIDSRLDAYRAERDALLARANGENTNDTPELSPEDRIRAQAIRYRMSQILGREVPELDGIENEDEHAIQNQLDDNEIDRFQELREEFNNDSTTPARKAELRIMMAQVLGRVVPELEGIENEDEHAIQNQLDDNEIDEFQELREELREINQRGDNTQDRDAQRREEIDRQLEELRRSESSYSAAIDLLNESPQNVTVNEDVNTLQDRLNSIREQIARLEEERQQLEGNQNRAPLTDAERRRLEQLNNIISELESLTREKVTERVPVDRTHDDDDGKSHGDDDDGKGHGDDDDGKGHGDDDDDGKGHDDDDDGKGHDDDDDGKGHDDDDDGKGHDDDDDGKGHDDDDDGKGHDDDDDGKGHDDDDDGHGYSNPYDAKNQRRLDLIAQSETQHIGTWDTIMRRNSKAKVFTPWSVGSSAAVGAVGLAALATGAAGITIATAPAVVAVAAAPIIITGAMKIAGKINNVVRGTNRKEAEMRDAINGMEPADFELLVDSLDKQTILNEKYGEVWLECVADRLEADNARKAQEIDARIADDLRNAREYQQNGIPVPEDIRRRISDAENEKKGLSTRADDLRDSIELKSHRKKNTKGRIGGVFNPDRTEFNKETADLYRKIGKATTQAERDEAIENYEKHRAEQVDNRSLFGGRFVFNKGLLNDAQNIEIVKGQLSNGEVNRSEPTFMKKLSSILLRGGSILMVANHFNDQAEAVRQTEAANQSINTANVANQQANATNQQVEALMSRVQQDLENSPTEQAIDDYAKMLVNDSFLQGHNREFIMEQLGRFNENGSDAILHQDLGTATQQFLQTASQSQKIQFIENVAIPMWQKNASEILNTPEAIAYIKAHPEYNMDSLWQNTQDLSNSGLNSVTETVKATAKAANDLKNVGIQDYTSVGNVLFTVPAHYAQMILTNGAAILHDVRDRLGIKRNEKVQEREEQPQVPEKQQPNHSENDRDER